MVELLLILGAAAVYGAGVTRAWDAAGTGRLIRRSQVACFAGGLAAIGVALVSPLDGMAEHSLTAHMIQHVVLIAVAAPLDRRRRALARGRGTFRRRRPARAVAASAQYRPARPPGGGRSGPASRSLPTSRRVALWHLPGAYDAALHNNAVHAAEHACFFFTAAVLWWAALGAGRRRGAAPGCSSSSWPRCPPTRWGC